MHMQILPGGQGDDSVKSWSVAKGDQRGAGGKQDVSLGRQNRAAASASGQV